MNTPRTTTDLVDRIIEASPAMPNAAAHRRYLEGLSDQALAERLAALLDDSARYARRWHGSRMEAARA